MIEGLIWLLSAQLAGELLSALLHLPIPGPIIGMLLLLIALAVRGGPGRPLSRVSRSLIRYLPLILIPPAVGLMDHLPLLRQHGDVLLATIVGTTLLSLILAALLGRGLRDQL